MSLSAAAAGVVVIDIMAQFRDQTASGMNNAQKRVDKFSQSIEKEKKQLDGINRTKYQVKLEARDKASTIIKDVSSRVTNLAGRTFRFALKVTDYATKPLRSAISFLTSIKGLIAGIVTGMAAKALIATPISLADKLTNASIGFETMLGSVKKGQKMMRDIQNFAIKTPFDTSEVISNTQTMMAYGFKAKDVLKDMRIIGDQAAATGRGSEGLRAISLALGQMSAHGKVDAQDMNQLTSAGVKGWDYLAKAMGKTKGQVMKLAQNGKISSDFGVNAILKGMEEYKGMMDKMSNRTASGLISQIKDAFNIRLVTKWGQGLQSGAIKGLTSVNDWINRNQKTLAKWGDILKGIGKDISSYVVSKLQEAGKSLNSVVNSPEFRNADVFGKISIAWDKVIADPFWRWWNSSGKRWASDVSEKIGEGFGSALKFGIVGLLGLDAGSITGEGQSVGGSFATGFSKGFDGKKVGEAFLKAIKGVFTDAGTLLPGGAKATSTSGISAFILGYLGFKSLKGIAKTVSQVKKLFSKSSLGSTKDSALNTDLMYVNAKVVYLNGTTVSGGSGGGSGGSWSNMGQKLLELKGAQGFLKGGQKLLQGERGSLYLPGSASSVSKYAKYLGDFGEKIPLLGTEIGALLGTVDIVTAKKGKKVKTTLGVEGNLGGGMIGAEVGAGIGSLIAPGVGTAAGAVIGGFGGSIAGEKGMKALYDKIKANQKGIASFSKEFRKTLLGNRDETIQKVISSQNDMVDKLSSSKYKTSLLASSDTLANKMSNFFAGLVNSFSDSFVNKVSSNISGTKVSSKSSKVTIGGLTGITHSISEKDVASIGKKVKKHADGGIFSTPHIGVFSEDGAEAIIPLSEKRRRRGLDLWTQAGRALGVVPYANGGISASSAASPASVRPTVQVTIQELVVPGGDAKSIKESLPSIANELAELLAIRLGHSFSNMPA